MILYVLKCTVDHRFEAWFRNSEAFDTQAASGAVSCPVCGDVSITKAPMAPMIGKGRSGKSASQPSADQAEEARAVAEVAAGQAMERVVEEVQANPSQAEEIAGEMRRHLTDLRKSVEDNCDYVGDRFAEEARRMHYGEAETRGIYGEASEDDAAELREEGVNVHRIPWLPRTNS